MKFCIAKNHTPLMQSGLKPAMMAFGKDNYFEIVEKGLIRPSSQLGTGEKAHRKNISQLLEVRNRMMRYDSERIFRICIRRNVRRGGGELPRIGDS